MKRNKLLLIGLIVLFISCNNEESNNLSGEENASGGENPTTEDDDINDEVNDSGDPDEEFPNILLIIADDMGLDATPGYDDYGDEKPVMNTLQGFLDNGVRFTNLWSNPTCTPTRSTILTGKYGFRTNMTKVGDQLSTTETSLQSYITNQTDSIYSQAIIGKWHLSSNRSHPTQMGIPHYAGILSGTPAAYDDWDFTENNATTSSNEYITTKFTDLAIDWVGQQTQPWFLWLAYTAPHTPFHLPPDNLHTRGGLADDEASIAANPLPYYLAMLESLDSEMGRLLDSIPEETLEDTVIIFIGDNGSPGQTVQTYPSNRAKGTVYQGGVNVPMIVTGKNVTRVNEVESALINTTDLFATIAELSGAGVSSINDSVSFKNLLTGTGQTRDYAYTEIGNDEGGSDYTIRNTTHKYILFDGGREALYNLISDPLETINLLVEARLPLSDEDEIIKGELVSELTSLRNQ